MICPTCEHSGLRGFVLLRVWPDGAKEWVPCPDCGGSGFANCCEGMREQPESEQTLMPDSSGETLK